MAYTTIKVNLLGSIIVTVVLEGSPTSMPSATGQGSSGHDVSIGREPTGESKVTINVSPPSIRLSAKIGISLVFENVLRGKTWKKRI